MTDEELDKYIDDLQDTDWFLRAVWFIQWRYIRVRMQLAGL